MVLLINVAQWSHFLLCLPRKINFIFDSGLGPHSSLTDVHWQYYHNNVLQCRTSCKQYVSSDSRKVFLTDLSWSVAFPTKEIGGHGVRVGGFWGRYEIWILLRQIFLIFFAHSGNVGLFLIINNQSQRGWITTECFLEYRAHAQTCQRNCSQVSNRLVYGRI